MNIMHKKIAILVLILATTAILQCASAEETVLRIGTQDVVKSASLLGDSSMGVFAHLSNPPLMKMNPDGTLSGQTAKSYSVSEDGMTWRFEIDDNLYWSDGTKLTPEDVKFTFEYISEKYPPAGWIKNTVDEISVDGNAVVFKLNKPYSRLNLEFTTYNILPPPGSPWLFWDHT